MKKIAVIFGTRPEAIKLSQLINKLKNDSAFELSVCVTAQHREMLDQTLKLFEIVSDIDLNLMTSNQSLAELTSRATSKISDYLGGFRPDLVVIQGDTTTTLCAALAAYYHRIPIAHVEAGLRTYNKYAPYPEEMNRRITSHLADLHFAPTREAMKNLLKEGLLQERIFVTGNTVIDALFWVREKNLLHPPENSKELEKLITRKRLVLVTGHRRENFGMAFQNICSALKKIAESNEDVSIVYPVHLNPNVRDIVFDRLGRVENIHLVDPLSYESFVWLLDKAHIVLTDSGGIQEEAPSLGVPVLVMRSVTERPEGIKGGLLTLIGTDENTIIDGVAKILHKGRTPQKAKPIQNPFGDGMASSRIIKLIKDFLHS